MTPGKRYTSFIMLGIVLWAGPGWVRAVELDPNISPATWAIRMARTIEADRPSGYDGWDYVTGTVLRGFEKWFDRTGDPNALAYLRRTVDLAVRKNGSISGYDQGGYTLDNIEEGNACLRLYRETGMARYREAADRLRSQLNDQPRTTEGGFWHKRRYPYQMWLDGLYMAEPFYAQYSRMFERWPDFNDVVLQFVLMETHARDPNTGLLYHGWDERHAQNWADPLTGCSSSFWGRGIGWYAMALVDVLDELPAGHPGRAQLIAILKRLADAMVQVQDKSGVWWQVVDQGGRPGNYLEASVSCMMTYAIAKGVRKGYLDASLRPVAQRAFDGILREFIDENQDGSLSLNHICVTAGLGGSRDGSYQYYVYGTSVTSNDGKGLGPFIGAGLEVAMMDLDVSLQAEARSGHTVELSWHPPAAACHGFTLERATDQHFVPIATVDANTTSFTDSNLSPLTAYRYRIRPESNTGISLYSDPVRVMTPGEESEPLPASYPIPVAGGSVTKHQIDLYWQPGLGAESHDIYFGTGNPPPFVQHQTGTVFHVDFLKDGNGAVYYWRIDEVNAHGTTPGPVWQFTANGRASR